MNYLTQSEKNDILALIGGHPDDEGMEPLSETPSEGPRFPYSAVRDRIKDYAPPTPKGYAGRDDVDALDDEEDTNEELMEEALKSFCRSKQGHEASPWILPSRGNRRELVETLKGMGCTMEG